MITTNLFNRVLVEPVQNGCNKLLIVSGYASSAMAFHHLNQFAILGRRDIEVKLIVGMSSVDGITLSNHRGFRQVMQNDFQGQFECGYRTSIPPVHSNLYLWLENDAPRLCFTGSANYTQIAFGVSRQKEILTETPVDGAMDYFESLVGDSIYCTHPDSENLIQIYNERYYRKIPTETITHIIPAHGLLTALDTLESITVPLLKKDGTIQKVGGLNWGQRPGREPNQAYIQLRPDVYRSNFFPSRSTHFTVVTDDDRTLICTRAQKTNTTGAAIETPQNNSLLGEYFRNRLGLHNGAFISPEDFKKYGRSDITFYKIDDENFYMDFSVH